MADDPLFVSTYGMQALMALPLCARYTTGGASGFGSRADFRGC
jgi:hypothetical protein